MLVTAQRAFSAADWTILGSYLAVVLYIGLRSGRRNTDSGEFFLAGRTMPMWAVAVSVVATSLSAATFLGGPELAYKGDLTYLIANLGSLIAAVLVALLFLPKFYALGVTSIYELLGNRFGLAARRTASAAFLVGRIFASGVRLFIVAIPFAWVAYGGSPSEEQLITSILAIGAVAALYTCVGGMRAVIWTDVLQAVVVFGTVAVAFGLLLHRIPLSAGDIHQLLAEAGRDSEPTQGKLRWLSTSIQPSETYTLWTAITGLTMINLAAYGTDQDLTQRMLTCRTSRLGSWSVIVANLISWPIVMIFLGIGLLLYIFYQRSDVMGAAAPDYEIDRSREVFVEFMLREMPGGLRGLMMAGLFAAAMSSLDSALNAMSAVTVIDFYRPWRRYREGYSSFERQRELGVGRAAVIGWAVVLSSFACVCVYWHEATELPLIDFALMVMAFAYSGLLAVFLAALLTRRGNGVSAVSALGVGFLAMVLMQRTDFGWVREFLGEALPEEADARSGSGAGLSLADGPGHGAELHRVLPGAKGTPRPLSSSRPPHARVSQGAGRCERRWIAWRIVDSSLQKAKRTRERPSAGSW